MTGEYGPRVNLSQQRRKISILYKDIGGKNDQKFKKKRTNILLFFGTKIGMTGGFFIQKFFFGNKYSIINQLKTD